MLSEFDIVYRPRVIGFGIDLGSNRSRHNKITNFFIEITFLFWTFGWEIRW